MFERERSERLFRRTIMNKQLLAIVAAGLLATTGAEAQTHTASIQGVWQVV
jgi:hypothetical protein